SPPGPSREWKFKVRIPAEALMIGTRNLCPPLQNGFQPLQLLDSQRAIDFREAVVVTQFTVLQPLARMGASLVALRPGERGNLRALGYDHATLTGGDLLVGIEREHPGLTERSNLAALVFSANRFARILNHPKAVFSSDAENGRQIGRVSESMHRQNGARSGSDRGLDFGGIEVQSVRVDIHKDRDGPLVADGIGHGDE